MSEPIARVVLSCGRFWLEVGGLALAMETDRCREPALLQDTHPLAPAQPWTREMLEEAAEIINKWRDVDDERE